MALQFFTITELCECSTTNAISDEPNLRHLIADFVAGTDEAFGFGIERNYSGHVRRWLNLG